MVAIIILLGFILFGAALKMKNENILRLGSTKSDFPQLKKGIYKVGENLMLEDGIYAIYSLKGSGEVRVEDKSYHLKDDLYQEAKKQMESTRNAVLFEEGEKVELKQGMEFEVISEGFLVSFVKR